MFSVVLNSFVIYFLLFCYQIWHYHLIIYIYIFQVHVIMYSYYFAALFGPEVQKKLEGIKKNITLIQMVRIFFLSISFNFSEIIKNWTKKMMKKKKWRKKNPTTKCCWTITIKNDIILINVFIIQYRSNLQLYSFNVLWHWHVAVMYQNYCLQFMYQMFCWYFICFMVSSRMPTPRRSTYHQKQIIRR